MSFFFLWTPFTDRPVIALLLCLPIRLQSTCDEQHVCGDADDDPNLLSIQTTTRDVLKHLFQVFKTVLQAVSGGTQTRWAHQAHHPVGAPPRFLFWYLGEFIRSVKEL